MHEALAALLRLSLGPESLQVQIEAMLRHLTTLPWLGLDARASLYLVIDPGRLELGPSVGPAASSPSCVALHRDCCLFAKDPTIRRVIQNECADRCLGIIDPEAAFPGGPCCLPIVSKGRRIGLVHLTFRAATAELPTALTEFLDSVADAMAGMIERSRVGESLRESEERFQLAAAGTDAGIWDWDLRTDHVYFSTRWKSQLGYADDEITHDFREWLARLHPDDLEAAQRRIREYLEGKTADYELEHRLRHKDGSYRWILARGAVVRDVRGVPYRMVGTHLDVTERRALEETLRLREARLIAARRIQERLLPQTHPALPEFDIWGASHPAEFTAGDAFDYLDLPDGSLGLVVADVSGHGFDAALLMATMLARLRTYTEFGLPLPELVRRLNRALAHETEGDRFVTCLLAVLEPGVRRLTYANTGHTPALVLGPDGQIKSILESLSLPLGIQSDMPVPIGGPIALERGDIVLLLTDGFVEARSRERVTFGIERLVGVVREHTASSSREILEALVAAVREHAPDLEHQDDMTAVVIKAL
jgi:PAS domain S-box-containing protein